MISTAQAKKMFYDWLDETRPWNNSKSREDVYILMEEIVAKAAEIFHGEKTYSEESMRKFEDIVLRLTADLEHHPESYDGPCVCKECEFAIE